MLTKLELENLMELMMMGSEITMEALYATFTKRFSSETHNLFRPCFLCLNLLKENVRDTTREYSIRVSFLTHVFFFFF
jgi:hypothetical protein